MQNLFRPYYFLLGVFLAVGILVGCQNTNPVAAADTPEQKAYAAYGSFVIFQEKAADLAEDPTVPNSIKLGLISAEERAKPIADNLLTAINEFSRVKAAFDAGNTSEDRMVIALNNLDRWVTELAPLVADLITSVQGAQP